MNSLGAYAAVAAVAFMVGAIIALVVGVIPVLRTYASMREWKERVIDALVISWAYQEAHETDPQKALSDLVTAEIQMALDPLISKEARDLIEYGRTHSKTIQESWVDPNQMSFEFEENSFLDL